MKFGIIGLGEVGKSLADGLLAKEHKIEAVDLAISETVRASLLASGAKVHSALGSWTSEMDAVIVCVNGGASNAVNRQLSEHLKPGQVVLDLTTASPKQKKTSAELVEVAGGKFLDVAIMGSIAMKGFSTAMLVSGDVLNRTNANLLRELTESGMALRSMPGSEVGDAICLKLIRSIYTKSSEALAVKCLITAEHFGVREELYDALADLDDIPIKNFINTLVTTHVVHAERRLKEVGEAKRLLEEASVSTQLLESVEAAFANTVTDAPDWNGDALPSIDQAIDHLKQAR